MPFDMPFITVILKHMGIHPNLRYQINLRVLKRLNNLITTIVNTASHAVLYEFNRESNQWTKLNCEGPIFIYRKTEKSYSGLFILNRLDLSNFEIELLNCVVTFKEPYIMLQSEDKIFGIWIHDSIERETMYDFIKKGIIQAASPPSPEISRPPGFEERSDNSNILMDMLLKAKKSNSSKTNSESAKVEAVVKNDILDYMSQAYKPLDRIAFELELGRILRVPNFNIG
eukprot:NODE_377_length_9768_cov_0.153584.p3 type:complete len:228 gc:universal NODE_377_length_9768_cov_0.153584:3982-3299(-)